MPKYRGLLQQGKSELGSIFYLRPNASSTIVTKDSYFSVCFLMGSGDYGGSVYNLNDKLSL